MVKIFTSEEFLEQMKEIRYTHQESYLAMYSSILGGVVTKPGLMLIPIDNHMVHRGDGVFEVIKCCRGYIYQFQAHLQRLQKSAQAIGIEFPLPPSELKQRVRETIKVAQVQDCVIRIFLSRGPGGFSVNPFDSVGSQLYIIITKWTQLPKKHFQKGVKAIISQVPLKSGFFAQIKSCNYLPNVLMKREALQKGADYAIGVDENGYLAEGATESVGVVSTDGYLMFPEIKRVLEGITLRRAFSLSQEFVKTNLIKGVHFCSIPLEEVYKAEEILLLGTTIDVLPVVCLEEKTIGKGKPGPVFKTLKELFEQDLFSEVSEPVE
jgi:branched-chain amino acid aminotransferase